MKTQSIIISILACLALSMGMTKQVDSKNDSINSLMAQNQPVYSKTRPSGERIYIYIQKFPYKETVEDKEYARKVRERGGSTMQLTEKNVMTCITTTKNNSKLLFTMEDFGGQKPRIFDAILYQNKGYIIYEFHGRIFSYEFAAGSKITPGALLAEGDFIEKFVEEIGFFQQNAFIEITGNSFKLQIDHLCHDDPKMWKYLENNKLLQAPKTCYTKRISDKQSEWKPDSDTELLFSQNPSIRSRFQKD
jgi:hypothetical protein